MNFLSFLQPNLATVDADGERRALRGNGLFAPTIRLIARRDCRFSRIRLPVASKAGLDAARMQARQGQRFASLRTRIEQDKDDPRNAGLWSWDGTHSRSTGSNSAKERVLPETLARRPMDNGIRLVKCLYGLEGEVWQDSQLVASRWWPTKPDLRDWQLFLRAAKHQTGDNGISVPEPELVRWRSDLPIIDRDPDNLVATFSPAKTAAAAAACLLFVGGFQVSQLLMHQSRTNHAERLLEKATRDNQDAYRARATALAAQAAVATKASIDNPVLSLLIVEAVTQNITEDIGDISTISISEKNVESQIRIETPPDITALARALEGSAYLQDVFIERPSAAMIIVKATIPDNLPVIFTEEVQPGAAPLTDAKPAPDLPSEE